MSLKHKILNTLFLHSMYYDILIGSEEGHLFKIGCKLGEEVGEVQEALFALDGSKTKTKKLLNKGQSPRDSVVEEVGDVVVVCLNLLKYLDISHDEFLGALENKLSDRLVKRQKELACQKK